MSYISVCLFVSSCRYFLKLKNQQSQLFVIFRSRNTFLCVKHSELKCGPMPDLMAALLNIDGVLCSMPQSLADAHYQIAVQ